jgi:hypothetical protein
LVKISNKDSLKLVQHKTIYHVQVKHKGLGWRLASQVYSKKSADQEVQKWKDIKEDVRAIKVKRRTKGLVRISKSGRDLGLAD